MARASRRSVPRGRLAAGAVALWLAAALGACGPKGPPPRIEIGSGATAYAPLADGDEVPMVYGPQGGQHVYGAILARQLVEPRADVQFSLYVPGAATPLAAGVERAVDLDPVADHFEHAGVRVILPAPDSMRGLSYRFVATLTASDGRVASDERVIKLK